MSGALIIEHRLVPRGGAGLCCDEEGVALGPVPLIVASRDTTGWRRYNARPAAEIAEALQLAFGPAPEDVVIRSVAAFARIAKYLTDGNQTLVAITAVRIGVPQIAPPHMAKLAASSLCKFSPSPDERGGLTFPDHPEAQTRIRKAASDDPKHPGWPAGTPDGRGGKFRPKGDAEAASSREKDAPAPPDEAKDNLVVLVSADGGDDTRSAVVREIMDRIRDMAARKALRTIAQGILRIIAGAATTPVPGVGVAADVAVLIDAAQRIGELAGLTIEAYVAIEFAKKGPRSLEELKVQRTYETC
jgi:hypothetical protein